MNLNDLLMISLDEEVAETISGGESYPRDWLPTLELKLPFSISEVSFPSDLIPDFSEPYPSTGGCNCQTGQGCEAALCPANSY